MNNTSNPAMMAPDFTTPFEHIALAFSGGGFRAASFSLGVLAYLDHVHFNDHTQDGKDTKLLHKVRYLSSASGGTIATSVYALYNAEGKPFGAYYKKLLEALQNDTLLDNTLRILSTSKEWEARPVKTRNLINSFAMAYDKYLFDGKTVDAIRWQEGRTVHTHLEEVCFNTTEFFRGLLFRQQVKLKPDPKPDKGFLYGNFVVNLKHETAASLKLADLLASSSCFPAGFEPIVFPDDFTHGGKGNDKQMAARLLADLSVQLQEGSIEELYRLYGAEETEKILAKATRPINQDTFRDAKLSKDFKMGMMDGGITDNQGLESMMRADERRQNGWTSFNPFDLMLVNDVGSHFMEPYAVPKARKKSFFNLLTLNKVYIISILLFLIGAGALIYGFARHGTRVYIAAGGMLTALTFAFFVITQWLRRKIKSTDNTGADFNLRKTFSHSIVHKLIHFLNSTPLRVFAQMLSTRMSSMLILNNDVFLKRIRQLLYSNFYDTPQWTNRGKANHVYDLAYSNDLNRARQGGRAKGPVPSMPVQKVAESAFRMGTTLWFGPDDVQKLFKAACLVATGQFTTCYNLLEYIYRLRENPVYATLDDDYKQRISVITQQLEADYAKFREDPFFLYNQLGRDSGVSNFRAVSHTDIPFPANFMGIKNDK